MVPSDFSHAGLSIATDGTMRAMLCAHIQRQNNWNIIFLKHFPISPECFTISNSVGNDFVTLSLEKGNHHANYSVYLAFNSFAYLC